MTRKPKWPTVYENPVLQERYEELRAAGNTDAFAQILTEQRAPGLKGTERAFSQGRNGGQDLDSWPSFIRDQLIADAKQRGISLQNKMYISGLAEYPCDSRALVSSGDDVVARCKATNKHLSGAVNYEAVDAPAPPPSKLMAEDLVQESIGDLVRSNPDLKTKPKTKLREMVLEKHASKRKTVANTA